MWRFDQSDHLFHLNHLFCEAVIHKVYQVLSAEFLWVLHAMSYKYKNLFHWYTIEHVAEILFNMVLINMHNLKFIIVEFVNTHVISELARDSLNRTDRFKVIGGMISPVCDQYEKKV